MDELIRQYAEHLRSERNVSPHTLRNYLSDLAQFQKFLIEKELCLSDGKKVDARKVDIHVVRAEHRMIKSNGCAILDLNVNSKNKILSRS